ncbi:antitoxin HicB [Synergistales bacterium]|nr:antitoxin HicB [Synergistales bacterium]
MVKKESVVYPALFDFNDEDIAITFPDLPGAISCADNEREAIFMAKDALGAWIIANEDLGNVIPEPSKLADISCSSRQRICLIDVWLPIFREERRNGSVKKNVTIPIWLNALAEKADLNFSHILQAGLKNTLGIYNK